MRQRSRLTADQWARRLDDLMAEVLAAPERYDRSTVVWARWRWRWLTERARREGGSNLYHPTPETAARGKFSQAAACLNTAAGEEVTNEET